MGVIPQGRSGLLGEELPSLEVFLLRAGLGAVGSGLRPSAPSTAWPQGGAMSQIKDWNYDKAKLQKLKLQYFGHFMQRVDSLEKTLMLGGIEGRRKRGRQRMRWPDGIADSMDVSLSELPEAWRAAIHGVAKSWTRRSG